MQRTLLHIIFLLLGVLPLQGQSFFFKTHVLKEPFHNAQLRAIYQDRQSLLWLTTSKGVLSGNGQTFEAHFLPDKTGVAATAFFQDKSGTYWLGYADGTIAHGSYRSIKTWTTPDTLFHSPIVAFEEDKQGRLWIATYGQGVYCWDGRSLRPLTDWVTVPVEQDIYVMVQDAAGYLLIGTDRGILRCKPNEQQATCQLLGVDDGLQDDIVRAILPDGSGGFWVGTYDNGVSYYSARTRSFQHLTPDWDKGAVTALAAFSERELWIGTADRNAWVYSFLDKQLRPVQASVAGNVRVADLHTDPEGNLWMIQNNQLLQTHRQLEFLQTDFENIQAILMDRKNRLWVGTPNGLFYCEPLHSPEIRFLPALQGKPLNVISLYEDRFGLIWAGTFGDGVYCLEPSTGQYRLLNEWDGLLNGSILSISGKSDQVWLATLGGVTEVENTRSVLQATGLTLHNFNQNAGLGTNYIYKTFVDSKDRVWFATDGKGISVFENGRITNFPTAQLIEDQDTIEMPLKAVYSITEDHSGHIWFSTDREGIFEYDGQHFQRLTVKEGIRDLAILSLTTDIKGNIIIVHSSGLDLLQPENHHLIYYDQGVGIDLAAPNLNAACTDQYGHVWIGFNREIIKYVPLNEALEIHPRTQLIAVKVLGEVVDLQQQQCLSHRQNYLEFEYQGLWYTDPEKVKYRYRLIGYDRDWIETKDHQVTYSKLPPGTYRFELTSTENDAWLD
ncbi:MAG: hypothetical protein KDC44_17950, partial [Phaeodactylibacter sp.]|nr:hypothetical protein [Phaeodactylibacter sp.]